MQTNLQSRSGTFPIQNDANPIEFNKKKLAKQVSPNECQGIKLTGQNPVLFTVFMKMCLYF